MSRTRALARVGTRLGRPVVLITGVVALVLTVGALATMSAYVTLVRVGEARADAWLEAAHTQLEDRLGHTLSVSDPLLDHLAASVRGELGDDRVEALVARLDALAAGRVGVAWVSVSYPDGTFVGVERGADGRYEAQASVPRPGAGEERRFVLDDRGRVQERSRTSTDYDPRRRPFYQLALREGRRAWTEPYAFLPDWHTGVTRVEPVYALEPEGRELLAVLTVDFDAVELTALLGEPLVNGQRTLVVTSRGAVLAAHGVTGFTPAPQGLSEEPPVPTLAGLDDPVVVAMRARYDLAEERRAETLHVAGEAYRYDAQQVADLSGQRVLLLTAVAERELYRDARQQAVVGAFTTGALTLLGLLLAMAISASLANHRTKRLSAEREARHAREQVRQLGRYELVARLGSGAMGEVYRARHTLLARDAALKLITLRDDHGEEADARREERQARFFLEAQRLASLHSLHTVTVHDFGVAEDGRYFLVMELLEGLDLASLVAQHGPQPPTRVAAILAQVCDSLTEAHEAGLVHQDIKPANVFLCRIAEQLDFVKVLDFGLARAVDAGERGPEQQETDDEGGEAPGERDPSDETTHTIEGTPAYMAPEQILGEPIGPAVDLYALGGLGFFLLTGEPPFPGTRRDVLYAQHVHGPLPTLPEELAARTPRMLVQALTRCLAKRPDHRPQSARVLADVFRKIASEHDAEFSAEQRAAWWARFDVEHPAPDAAAEELSGLLVRLDAAHSRRRRVK